ncbi:MAG: efflux RND transporter periplasmic adaptor subunit [Porticoccaceae bacterium]|nr:efflux RND transporter periplasmic adaptor subunit [Porticoccaceae bacterium]
MPKLLHGVAMHIKTRPARFLVIVLLAAGLAYWAANRLFAAPAAPDYLTATVNRGDIEETIGSLGTLEPKDYVDVGTQVSGQLQQLLVDIGDQVAQGQLLAEIDPTVYESRVRSSRATLSNLRAQLTLQEAEQLLASRRLERNRNLYRENAVSEDVLLASETEVTTSAARIESLKAQIDSAEATLDGDVANLGYTKIYAPMSGTVVDSAVVQGQTVNASQTTPTIVRIANLDTMTVRVQVSEADVVRIQEGMPVYFTTLGLTERRWYGTVRKVLPTPETLNNVVLFHVLIDVENPDGMLMTSMTAQVFFILAEARDTLVVPASAVTALRGDRAGAAQVGARRADGAPASSARTPSTRIPSTRTAGEGMPPGRSSGARPAGESGGLRHQVQVVTASGIETRPVRVGVSSRTEVAILAGLDEGEQVVIGRAAASGPQAAPSRSIMSMGGPGIRGR